MVRELVKGLDVRGYEVLVLHRGNAAPRWLQGSHGRMARGLGDCLLSFYLGRKLLDFQDRQFAAVISNGPIGWYLPELDQNPVRKLHIYHGTYRQQAEAARPFIKYQGYLKLKWWDSMILERACGKGKLVICNSDQTRDEVHRFFGFDGITTWLPLDTSHFRPLDRSDCRRTLGLPEQGPVGLFAGSVHPVKGFQMVRTLMRLLPGVRWLLALRGSIPADLGDDLRVKIFANASYDLLPILYAAADFTVFPSRYDSFGYVVAEALACGTPVIAAPSGASRLFLEAPPLDSLLMKGATDPEEYIGAAQKVLSDAPRYRQAVLHSARPKVLQTMAPENWWPRFLAVTGL